MKKSKWLLACAGFFTLLNASSVFAENRPGAISLTLADAYYHFDSKRHLNNIGMPNIELGYDVNDRWAVEAGFGVVNTDPTASADNGNRGVHGQLYTLDGIYRFTPYKMLDPYLIAGVGILGLKPISTDTQHQGNVNAGVGTQIFFSRDIALRGEVRDFFTTTGSAKNDIMINFGISILFGGEQVKPVSLPVEKPSYKGE